VREERRSKALDHGLQKQKKGESRSFQSAGEALHYNKKTNEIRKTEKKEAKKQKEGEEKEKKIVAFVE